MSYAFVQDAPFWNDLAERYAAKPVDDPNAFERKIAITRALIPAGGRFLDVGCGTGSLALRLADVAAEVHGLDLSQGMIDIARRKAQTDGVDHAHFHVGDLGSATDLTPGSFDVVSAYSLLHLVPDRAATLAALHRLARPGGSLVVSSVSLGNSWIPYGLIIKVMRWLGKAPHVRIYDGDAIVREVEAAGFVDVTVHDVGAKSSEVTFLTAKKPG